MLQAAQLIICNQKLKIYKNFRTTIPRNKQNMFITILLTSFITYFAISFKNCQTQYRQKNIQGPIKDLRFCENS